MKRSQLLTAGVVAVAVTVAPMSALAQNADPHASAHFIGKIHVHKKTATLKVRYRCASGEALWVSAKQVASTKKDTRLKKEGSSKTAAAWWQSHRNKFVCNGKNHTATFSIDKVEPGSKGKLEDGKAWVQFCVTQGKQTLILSKSGWVGVKS
ncbi:MAG: hypothetical protein QOE60_2193 [Thermoleophilaceae bacterium]|jgi:hypothetical protein|nr:hypothetical protein [Thermoleophilaceae bacterium]